VFGVPYYLSAFIFGVFLAKRASKSRLMTIPDQLQAVYGSKMAVGAAAYVFFMALPSAYILMLGVLIQLVFGTSLTWGVIIAAAFTTGYMFIGGFKSDLHSDWVNFILMFSAIFIVLVVIIATHGGLGYLKANVPATHFQWNGGNSIGYVLSWYLIALSALMDPSFYQRVYASRDPRTARWGILLCIPFWMLFDFMTTALGLYSRAILGPDINGMYSYPYIADRVLGPGLKALFFIGMIATIQSTVDSYTLLAASTLAHDVLWKARRVRNWMSEVWLTRSAMIIGTVLSIWIGLAAKSVVDIWNRFGSLGTPGLMLPLALSYSPRWRYRVGWAAANMIISPAVVGWWFIARGKTDAAIYPFPYSIEPIYIGIAVALLLLGLDHVTRQHNEAL
jgi:solute:Na+ symporter, SSS family